MLKTQDFTSMVTILTKAGHQPRIIKLEKPLGGALKGKKPYVWFPTLQIIVAVDTNACYQLRRGDDGWYIRMNRKNQWYPCAPRAGGKEFEKLIEPHYVAFLNNVMMGDFDAAQPEGSGVQGSHGPQAD